MATAVFPIAVGPQITMILIFSIRIVSIHRKRSKCNQFKGIAGQGKRIWKPWNLL